MKKAILLSTIVVAILVVIALLYRHLSQSQAQWIQGSVACTSYRASSKIPGRIIEIRISEGEWVEQGEWLYRLSTPELDARLEQALGAKNTALALDEKALKGARSEQKIEAMSLWQKAQTGLTLAKQSYDRIERLFQEGVVPAQQYDEAKANWEAAASTERAARAQYELVLAGASSEDRKAAAGGLQQATGAVAEVESYLRDAWVYAPTSGEVGSIVAEPGELVSTGFPVVTILQTQDPWVRFNLREDLLSHLRMGSTIQGYVPALDRTIEWKIYYIAPQADYATWQASRERGYFDLRTFEIKARPVTDGEGLRPGMSVLINRKELN